MNTRIGTCPFCEPNCDDIHESSGRMQCRVCGCIFVDGVQEEEEDWLDEEDEDQASQ